MIFSCLLQLKKVAKRQFVISTIRRKLNDIIVVV